MRLRFFLEKGGVFVFCVVFIIFFVFYWMVFVWVYEFNVYLYLVVLAIGGIEVDFLGIFLRMRRNLIGFRL